MKVWFQNRRTKHKRLQSEDGCEEGRLEEGHHDEDEEGQESDCEDIDVDSPPSPTDVFRFNPLSTGTGSDDDRHVAAKMPRLSSHDVTSSNYQSANGSASATDEHGFRFESISKMVPWAQHVSDTNENRDNSATSRMTQNGTKTDVGEPLSSSCRSGLQSTPNKIINKRPWESTLTKNNNTCSSSYAPAHETSKSS